MSDGLTISVKLGGNLSYSFAKPIVDTGSGKTAALVSSLREAQVQVNKFLTELVEKNGSGDQNQVSTEKASDDEDDEEESEINSGNTRSKRKNEVSHISPKNDASEIGHKRPRS